MPTTELCALDYRLLTDARENCTEAHDLGARLHWQLEQLALGNAPEQLQQLHNIVGRLSVVLARMAGARDQLTGLLQHLTARPIGGGGL